LKKANVAVHTIALADTADHELLRAIALETDGWYEQVDTAEALQRVFLHLFEKAAKRDTVPLTDNHFKIDSSIDEMTLLVFRSNSKPTELVLPNQKRLKKIQSTSGVRWHSEKRFDLITIDKPMSGAWFIDADLDPDNRVMVVTNLKLKTTDLPNNILIGETFDLNVSLTEKGKVIVRKDFLSLVDAQMREESEIADPIERELNSALEKGVYRTHVGDTFQPGRNDVVITMTSPTFERQRRQSINVVAEPFRIYEERLTDRPTRTHRITVRPDASLVKTETMQIAAMLTANDGSEWSYDVMKVKPDEWQLTLADLQDGDEYSVALQIRGETHKGRGLFLQPELIKLIDEYSESTPDSTKDETDEVTEESTEVDVESSVDNPDKDTLPEPVQPEIVDEMAASVDMALPSNPAAELLPENDELSDQSDAMSDTNKLLIGNAIIILFIAVSFMMWRRQRKLNSINPGDKL
jgi:uncharacterized protein (TIGR03503 family)